MSPPELSFFAEEEDLPAGAIADGHTPNCSRFSLGLLTERARGFSLEEDVLLICSPECRASGGGHGEPRRDEGDGNQGRG